VQQLVISTTSADRACCVDHKSDDMWRCCVFVVQLVVQYNNSTANRSSGVCALAFTAVA